MFKYEPLKLHLQFFGEEPPTGEPTPPPVTPELSFEAVQKYIQESEDAKKWLQAEKDSHFSKSLDTWKQNNLDKLVDEKIKQLYPEETPEQQELRKMQQEIENMKREKQISELKVEAVNYATEKKLPTKIIDRFIGDDVETTKKNLDDLASVFEEYIQARVDERFKSNGYNPTKGGEPENLTFAEKLAREKAAKQQGDGIVWGSMQQTQPVAPTSSQFSKLWGQG